MTTSDSRPDNGDGEHFFDIQKYLDSLVRRSNAAPLEDFSGLSPDQMHHLLYHPLDSVGSPVCLRESISDGTLDSIPFFRLVEEFVRIVKREEFIKLTPKGALPRKILHELYGFGFLKEESIEKGYVKLMRESDSVVLTTLSIVASLGGLASKKDGRFTLTNRGRKFVEQNHREEMFRLVLQTFTGKFAWEYNDRYPVSEAGQLGWGYTVFLILKFGETDRTAGFYADKYMKAFPTILMRFKDDPFGPARRQCTDCYTLRVFSRFLKWFGFVQFNDDDEFFHREKSLVKSTDVLAKVFALK
ncbi:MAG: hypothetical protein M1395_00440 [Bacteroidetes bacterium]|jgi:hypothetical protein|nr:hypothetical protein [Bacteroidota bacterium]